MKRDVRLQGLSSDHHRALVLAHGLVERNPASQPEALLAHELKARFVAELEPHFQIEEEVLLPALRAAGEDLLAARTQADHVALRSAVTAIENGDYAQIPTFAERLTAHVRFEERELFPCCEARLPDEVLAAAGQRAPKGPRAC